MLRKKTSLHLFLGRKAMKNLYSIFNSRDITLLMKIYIVKAIVFPVVIYGCESWNLEKAEHRRIHAFKCYTLGIKLASCMTNPDSILKSRDIALPTKVCLVKAMVFQ